MIPTRFGDTRTELVGEFQGEPESPLVVLVHGLCGNRSRWARAMGHALHNSRVSSLSFDLAGHGDSEGGVERRNIKQNLSDVHKAIEHAQTEGYSPIGIFGNSYGGLLSVLAAENTNLLGVGLQSPVWSYKPVLDHLEQHGVIDADEWKEKGVMKRTIGGSHLELPFAFYEQAGEFNGLKALANTTSPVLITHGTHDQLAPYEMSKMAAAQGAELKTYQGADHACSAEFEDIKETFTNFFLRQARYNAK